MALTVGELLATISVDAGRMRSGLRDAESHMRRSGETIGSDADRSGQSAGSRLGEGAAGGFADKLSLLKGTAIGAGALVAGGLLSAFSTALEQGQITGKLGAQLGATPAEAKKYGDIAGSMYADAITEDFQGAADAIGATMRAGLVPPDATNAQIKSISTKVSDLANTFELDLGQTANAVGQMIKTGLAKNGTEALDALTAGMQRMGPRADDLMDTFNEYSTQFRNMGLDAKTATGLLSQGMKAGARDTDVVADAIKEFSIEAVAGSDKVAGGFRALGLNSSEMFAAISKGGGSARGALDKTLDSLRKVKDPAERNAIAVQLFGTKAEDLGEALYALDPSKAVDALGKVGGAAGKMGDSLRDNAGTRVEQFKRSIEQGVVNFLGGKVIPAVQGFTDFVKRNFTKLWDEAGKGTDNLPDRIVKMFSLLAEKVKAKVLELTPKVINALTEFGQKVADYVMSNPEQVLKIAAIAGALIIGLASLPELIATALLATATIIVAGFVRNLIAKTRAKIGEWWTSFTDWVSEKASQAGAVMHRLGAAISAWFSGLWSRYVSGPVSRAWSSFINGVKGLPGRAVGALSSLGGRLSGTASSAWQRFLSAASAKMSQAVSWVRGLPGRIRSAVGSLGSLLYSKGADVVRGLWRGIQSMGGWLRSTLSGWARRLIPGPIAKALGSHSPSRVMAREVGRWIPAGVVRGIESGQGAVARTMAALVQPPPVPALAPALAGGYGASPFAAGPGQTRGGPLVQVEHWHAAENGTPDDNARALEWLAKARG